MLFLMLLEVDFKHFFKLGKSLLIAYALAVFSPLLLPLLWLRICLVLTNKLLLRLGH